MCCFASEVESVRDTNIFVGTDGARQLTVYQMSVELLKQRGVGEVGNAMILPVRASSVDDVDLVDMSASPDFFKLLDLPFKERSRGLMKGGPAVAAMNSAPLEVHKVGSYDVSIAGSISDLSRLRRDIFKVSLSTARVLSDNYRTGTGFVFVVAVLRDSGEFHPLAYTSPLSEGTLFIPTRHAHGGNEEEETSADWDHRIYFTAYEQRQGFSYLEFPANREDTRISSGVLVTEALALATKEIPDLDRFMQNPNPNHAQRKIARTTLRGRFRNHDLVLKLPELAHAY